ncbi:MAG TPA: PAS domain S-box protein, partial [Thermoleophilaceae bacterium]|nr:PAS domain S-box protein [Thermoleophilaceae bacterium]
GRAGEAAGSADRHAGRAGEQAGQAESVARRMAEAADAAERRAAQAEQAAAEAAELARRSAQEAGAEAEAVRRAVEEAGAEAQAVRRAVEDAAGGRAPEVGAANNGETHDGAAGEDTDPRRPLIGRKQDTGPAREPRPGFDDVKEPMATIEMDGHFRELNQAFTDLVGYSEEDFKSASWPPVMDRSNLPKHREQMKRMIAGEIESADVTTGYVHAQGLLVPVIGTISLVKVDGEPDHFLLAAKS